MTQLFALKNQLNNLQRYICYKHETVLPAGGSPKKIPHFISRTKIRVKIIA
jgi:hypothetical protein